MNVSAPAPHHAPYRILSSFYFVYFCLLGIHMPYWHLFLEDIGYTKLEIGSLAFIGIAGRIVAPTLWGYLADKTGQRMLWIRIACAMQMLLWLIIVFLPTQFAALATVLMVFALFQNGIVGLLEQVTLFWLKDHFNRYGAIRLWGSLGFLCAVSGFGFYFDVFSVRHVPMLLLFFSIASFINALCVPDTPARHTKTPSVAQPHINESASLWNVLRQPSVYLFFIASFLMLLSHAAFYNFYSNYLKHYTYSEHTIGVLWGVGVLAEIVLFHYAKHWLNQGSQSLWLCVCFIGAGVRWAMVGLFPHSLVLQWAAQCLHAFTFAMMHTLTMRFIAAHFSPKQQGRAQGLYNTTWGIGVGVGALIVGGVWDTLGGTHVFMASSALAFCSLGLVYALDKAERSHHSLT